MGYLPRFPSPKGALEDLTAGASPSSASGSPLARQLASTWLRLRDAAETIAAYSAAAAMYHDLARLSDAELNRRGLSRASLARDVLAACEGLEGPGRVRQV